MRIFRFIKIVYTLIRFGLDEVMLSCIDDRRIKLLLRITTIGRRFADSPAVRLRRALESLGPIFVKFGQMLSTRRDVLLPDFASELTKLQDQVPPFDSALAMSLVENRWALRLARCSMSLNRFRWPAPRSPRYISPSSRKACTLARKWPSRCCARTCCR